MRDFFEDTSLDAPRWLMDKSASEDVVLGAEIVAPRNIEGFAFSTAIADSEKEKLSAMLQESLDGSLDKKIVLSRLVPIQRFRLSERWTLPLPLVEKPGHSILLTNSSESESVVICGTDHLTIRASGIFEKLQAMFIDMQQLIFSLQPRFCWATNPRLGLLSPNPANCGAGYIISAMLHVPGILIANKVGDMRQVARAFQISIRDLWIGGFDASDPFIKLVTTPLIGKSPEELLANISQATEEIIGMERNARKEVHEKAEIILLDKVMRAHGIVQHARLVELWEFNGLVSTLRLGAAMGILPFAMRTMDEILVVGQQAHIGTAVGHDFTPMEGAKFRAQMMRDKLEIV